MSAATNQSELRLARLMDERDVVRTLHENLIAAIESTDDKTPSDSQREQITMYREKAETLDTEIGELTDTVERERTAIETSKTVRRVLAGNSEGVEIDGDGLVYNDFATYARDEILARTSQECSKIAILAGGEEIVMQARERLQLLKRTPANTLSSNVGGLTPAQHIDQIFQVINKSRAARRVGRPVDARAWHAHVSVGRPAADRVRAGFGEDGGREPGMHVSMQTATASTYLGGGDLSWQAINWSTPDALQLWFGLAAADYALKTEQDAAQALQHSAFSYNISSTLAASSTFAQWMTAIGAGYSDVFTNSGRIANTLYLAPDLFGYLLGLTSSAFTQFMSVSADNMGPLNIVVSRGMDAGVAVSVTARACWSRRRPVLRSSFAWSSRRSAVSRSASSVRSRPSSSTTARSR
jgi:hypothetical protein